VIAFLSQGLMLGGAAAAQPGPFQAYLLALTLKLGWQRALPATLAPLLSDGPIILIVLVVLTRSPAWTLSLLQVVGGFFLIYLALGAYRTFRLQPTTADTPASSPTTSQSGLFKGAMMNALSPNPYIFWATIAGPIFIIGWRQGPAVGFSFVVGFYLALIGGFAAFVALFSLTRRLDERIQRALSVVSALALLIFGRVQIWRGVAAFAA
jgi:threonine/homoserine/homoserine lactone efflux protein